jgi:WD40 repeat protein
VLILRPRLLCLHSTYELWNCTSQPLLTLHHDDYVGGAMWSADERRILSWSYDDTVRVWDAETGEVLLALRHDDRVVGGMWKLVKLCSLCAMTIG